MIATLLSLVLAPVSPRLVQPARVDLTPNFQRLGLAVCNQNGPLCWDYTTVGVLEYELAQAKGASTRLSPGFLAWAATETDHEGSGGSNFGRANRGLEKYGIAPLALGGDPDKDGVGAIPNDETRRAANAFGEIDFHWLRFWNDHDELSPAQMAAIKADLADGHPVAVGMRWPNHTRFVPNTFTLQVPARRAVFDGHCVVLVGYEDDPKLPGGGAFLFRNSWGDRWADGGYARMPYALLSFCINDAFSARVHPAPSAVDATPQTIEAESLTATAVNGPSPSVQEMARFGDAWGGGRQLVQAAPQLGDGFTLRLPVARTGRYDVRLVVTRAEDYGQYVVKVAGGRPMTIDGAGPGVSRSRPISLGVRSLKKGDLVLSFSAIGHDAASSGNSIGIDQVQLVPVP